MLLDEEGVAGDEDELDGSASGGEGSGYGSVGRLDGEDELAGCPDRRSSPLIQNTLQAHAPKTPTDPTG